MASGGPTVTLTFAGDPSKLEKAFDQVGASSKEMAGEVGQASKQVAAAGQGFDRMGDSADRAEQRAMGFRDTITGVQDSMLGFGNIMRGNVTEGLLQVGMGFGDLASGMANLLIPALKSGISRLKATRVGMLLTSATQKVLRVTTLAWAAAQRVLNAAMRANPLGIIITVLAALVAGLIWAYRNSETFRKIVDAAFKAVAAAGRWMWENVLKPVFNAVVVGLAFVWRQAQRFGAILGAVWNAVVAGAQRLWRGIRSVWNRVVGFLRGAARRIGGFFSGMWDGITGGLKAALNGAIWLINRAIAGINGLISTANRLPGVGIPTIGRIPFLHQGGIVPGSPGQDVLAVLQAGETVIPASRSGAGGGALTVSFVGNTDNAVATLIMQLIRSGRIQLGAA